MRRVRALLDRLPSWDEMRRWHLTLAYMLLVVTVVIALAMTLRNQQGIEANAEANARQTAIEAHANCEAINTTRDDIAHILEALIGRGEDDPEEAAAIRAEIFERVGPIVEHRDCPPHPDENTDDP